MNTSLDRTLSVADAPSDARAWLVRGYSMLPEGRLEDARVCFSRAAELAPDSAVPVLLDATVVMLMGDLRCALRLIQRLGRRHPEVWLVRLHEAEVLLRLGRERRARKVLESLTGASLTEEEAMFAAALGHAVEAVNQARP